MRLGVEIYRTLIGTLEGTDRTFDFLPSEEGIARFGLNSRILSVAIPLSPNPRRDHAKRRRNWFSELLPEGDQLEFMMAQSGLGPRETLRFLARYGRDVAGALQIWDLDDPTEPKTPQLRPLDDSEVRQLLEDPISAPLANQGPLGKSSLGGVQPKIVLVKGADGWAQALGGYPSTHILKPQLYGPLSSVIFDEEYGARIAHQLGLTNFRTSIEDFAGLATLVIERYDRENGERIHQEDFSQILGAQGNEKYQEVGGVVSYARMARTLRDTAPRSSMRTLARMTMLAVAIGNLDMHTKNVALLHSADGSILLAPAYDIVPQAHMNNDGKMALAINKKYRHQEITRNDLSAEFAEWGLKNPDQLIDETLEEVATAVEGETPLQGAYPYLQEQIGGFIGNLRHDRAVGAILGTPPCENTDPHP